MKPSRCFFNKRPGAGRCDGRYDRAHLIPQRLLERELGGPERLRCAECGAEPARPCVSAVGARRELKSLHGARRDAWIAIVWDHRAWVPACRRHHRMLDDSRTLRLELGDLPVEFVAYVGELALLIPDRDPFGAWLDQEYGAAEAAA